MISAARKDMLEALKWSKKNSPVAYLVLSMNGKQGTPQDHALNIVAAFNRLWLETKAYLKTVATMSYKGGGKIISSEMDEFIFWDNSFYILFTIAYVSR